MVRETAGLIQFAEYDTTAAITPAAGGAAIALLAVPSTSLLTGSCIKPVD